MTSFLWSTFSMKKPAFGFLTPPGAQIPCRLRAPRPQLSHRIRPLTTPTCTASNEASKKRRRRRPERKSSSFENTIDDMTMKRMGRGTIYYGERASTNQMPAEELISEDELLKPDSVLVTGGTGRTGQWVTLGLLNQGFNVRCFSRSFDRVEKIFGPSGSNVDVFEGDLSSFEDVYEAVDGAISIVCASGAPWWWPGGFEAVDVGGVQNLVDAALKTGTVKRFVLISAADQATSRGKAKAKAENIVKESGLPYVILRAANLLDTEGGIKQVILSTDGTEPSGTATGGINRLDLAQSVCQAVVYDRSIAQLREDDPDSDFDFPSCVATVENGSDPYIPDKRFWKRAFNRISEASRDDTEMETLSP